MLFRSARLAEIAPGHLATVREYLIDVLDGDRLEQLSEALEKVADQAGGTARAELAEKGVGR